jgi:hypothetical protein
MKLYTYVTPSHERLLQEWLLPSAGEFDVELVRAPQVGALAQHEFGTEEFRETMRRRIGLVRQAISAHKGSVFVFADADIQFFLPCRDTIVRLMRGVDFAVQADSIEGDLNAGFFACRGTPATAALWAAVERYAQEYPEKNEQEALNTFLAPRHTLLRFLRAHAHIPAVSAFVRSALPHVHRNAFNVRWRYLPLQFFSPRSLLQPALAQGAVWRPGVPLRLPRGIVLHHANWTQGCAHKQAQLAYVRRMVSGKERIAQCS